MLANVQVVVNETTATTVKLSLMDNEGSFHKVAPFDKSDKESQPEDEVLQRLVDTEWKK